MKVWRGFTLTLWTVIMALCIAVIILEYAFSSTVLDKEKTKSWLATSSLYDTVRDTVFVDQVTTSLNEQYGENKLVDASVTKTVLAEAFPRTDLGNRLKPVIDGAYAWLDSKSPEITFEVPVADKKDQFYRSLEVTLGKKITALPACSGYFYPPEEALLGHACLPSYVTAGEATQAVMGGVRAVDFPLGNTVSAESLELQSMPPAVKRIPTYLNYAWVLTYVAITVLVFLTGFVLLTRKLTGVGAVGVSMVLGGISALLLVPLMSHVPSLDMGVFSQSVEVLLQTLLPKFAAKATQLALLVTLLGIVLIAATGAWKWRQRSERT